MEDQEVLTILLSLDVRDRVLVETGLYFGTRISEALELRFGDLAGQYLAIRSKKGSERQQFEIPAGYRRSIEELKTYYQSKGITVSDQTFLFLSRKGENKPITRQQASHIIRTVCREVGITGKVNSHSFRKVFVSRIYELTGHDIAQTKIYSRHKNLANLDYYIKTTEKTSLVHSLSWGI
ncbi:MAG: tyrosine-type recombinase/integrase [Nitrososphaerota archaeon]